MSQFNLAHGAVAPQPSVIPLGRKLGPVIVSPGPRKTQKSNSAAVPLLSGTSDEWKAEIKAAIARKKIKIGSDVTDNSGRVWTYIRHLQESDRYFLVAKEDYVDVRGRERFTHNQALAIAAQAGAQLMNCKTGMVACHDFHKGTKSILRGFKNDIGYWLSDLGGPERKHPYIQYFDGRPEYVYIRKNSKGPMARKACKEELKIYNCYSTLHKDSTARVRLALEL